MITIRSLSYTNLFYVYTFSRVPYSNLRKTFHCFSYYGDNVNNERFSKKPSCKIHWTSLKAKFSSFDAMISRRRNEAKRSILVQVQSENSYPELYSYCTKYGTVDDMYHYSISEELQFILVQFSTPEDLAQIMSACGHVSQGEIVPVQSPLVWFRVKGSNINTKFKKKLKQVAWDPGLPPLKYGSLALSKADITEGLTQASSISQQMEVLHSLSKLDELGSRLRFFTAHQVELALKGLFPNARALPFGSSVNSFGRKGSDLDLCLQLDKNIAKRKSGEEGDKTAIRLVFQTKTISANERAQMQRQMETVGDILQLFLPGCSHVRRILQARVPIVKYHHNLTALDCDLSMTNLTAVYMSELLWTMGSLDSRVHPLVFFIRHWAKAVDLTHDSPGPFITNFTLTLLIIHFLQCCKPYPILPSLTTLISMAGPQDRRISDDAVNCTFLRDISQIPHSKNKESLHSLLYSFYEFYSSFDFNGRGISLAKGHCDKTGIGVTKPDASPLYVENPLERMLNVSKNVSVQELERFKIELRNAAWIMEELTEHSDEEGHEVHARKQLSDPKSGIAIHTTNQAKEDNSKKHEMPWGIMALLNPSTSNVRGNSLSIGTMMKINARGRLMKVTDLFDGSEKDSTRVTNKIPTGAIPAAAGRKR